MNNIIITLGPATENKINEIINEGVNIIRLNLSHNQKKWHFSMINKIREINKDVKIMIDTKGPEIRTGELNENIEFKKGDRLTLVGNESAQNVKNNLIYCNYLKLPKSVKVDDIIKFDGGNFSGKVQSVHNSSVITEVLEDGILGSRKHVNLPGIRVDMPTISKFDKRDLEWAKMHNVDMIAVSFVRHVKDILEVREIVGDKIQIVAKIECAEGYKNINSIAKHSDGVMVARGDLGVEVGLENLPTVQKNIIEKVKKTKKTFSIVGTGLLRCMVDEPVPHRSEISDIALANWEGTDYFMLSDETSIGKYPIKSIQELKKIIAANN